MGFAGRYITGDNFADPPRARTTAQSGDFVMMEVIRPAA